MQKSLLATLLVTFGFLYHDASASEVDGWGSWICSKYAKRLKGLDEEALSIKYSELTQWTYGYWTARNEDEAISKDLASVDENFIVGFYIRYCVKPGGPIRIRDIADIMYREFLTPIPPAVS